MGESVEVGDFEQARGGVEGVDFGEPDDGVELREFWEDASGPKAA